MGISGHWHFYRRCYLNERNVGSSAARRSRLGQQIQVPHLKAQIRRTRIELASRENLVQEA
jgi:hypothetical protein